MTSQRIRAREREPLSLGELQRIKTLIEEMYGEKATVSPPPNASSRRSAATK